MNNVVFVPISSEIYNEFVLRYGDARADVASTIENVVADYLERTKDEQYWGEQYLAKRDAERILGEALGDPDKGYQWLAIFLPNGTKLKMAYKGRDYYAEVVHEKIMYEGESFSPSGLANCIASGTARNAWRDLWIKRPRDKEWLLADDLRRNRT
ncbi:hypothetical protein SAMN05216404_11528 [Nitrosospira multiformis]|uniref:Uncharacterized protein n=1 Tax=Nitrosospira multiformis TaxID=1231 RepID=A0A1H8N5F3_9PROT|nr:hypothetical protein [Nitrosospira multiformis]SEO24719.1 hypothetical protein SAMN05216404_11528 [Nitrosospira multiformis]